MNTSLKLQAAVILFLLFTAFIFLSDVHELRLFNALSSSLSKSSSQSSYYDDTFGFEGAVDFLTLLRKKYQHKMEHPLPHCQRNATISEQDRKVEIFNRAIEVDWIGRDIPAVEPNWSGGTSSSCNFVGMAFPPTKKTLQTALQQTTYISSFHTGRQCEDSFMWDSALPVTCMGNNFGGTLGTLNEKKCIEETSGGYPMMLWNERNSNEDIYQCLKHFLEIDDELRVMNATTRLEGANIANLTKLDSISKRGYCPNCIDVDWNTLGFLKWSQLALESINITSEENMVPILQRLMNTVIDGKNTTLTNCVDALLPPFEGKMSNATIQKRMWNDIGLYLSKSTMEQSPSALLRNFSGSIQGVLPPAPNVIYSQNAIVGAVLNVDSEAYYPGCTPYWNAVLRRNGKGSAPKNAFKATNAEAGRNGTIFADLKSSPHMLRSKIMETCAESEKMCPFPTYDFVIDVNQVYCHAVFHFMIEIWPRIGPLLSGLVAENMPHIAIRVGCDVTFHEQFYELAGLENITVLGPAPVFAREVIAPTQGFSHSPLLNYWSLTAMREKVIENLSPIEKNENKTVLVIIRDASRRPDVNVFSKRFLAELSEGLSGSYTVKTFRSSDRELMSCIACQARAFMTADVIIGSHGAGLSHTLFAPRGAVVIERITSGDSQIYAELPFMLGMKYFPMDENVRSASAFVDVINFAEGYREDTSQHLQTIITGGQNDGHLRQLQTRTWKTNSNHQYSGINSDGTTAEGHWARRVNRGLRNAGIVLAVVSFIVLASISVICRCYRSFRYDSNIDDDDNHQENERSDGVYMPPVSSGYSA